MSAVFSKIDVGDDFSEKGIREAIDRNVDAILLKKMSRFEYALATLQFDSVRDLPLLHTMDHRIRLPRLQIDDGATDGDLLKLVTDRLGRMLCVSDHVGARELAAEALNVDPVRDAATLVPILRTNRRLFDLMLRGRLGSALALAKKLNFSSLGADGFQDLAANLLCYHCAHQVQLIVVRGQALDQFAYKLAATGREFTASGACKNVAEILTLIEAATRRVVNETNQSSQAQIIKDLEPKADGIRASIRQTDDELLSAIGLYLQDNRGLLNAVKDDIQLHRQKLKNSLHKTVFGLTAFETLIFSASRLVQLNLNASKIIEAEISGRSNRFNFFGKDLPPRENKAVSKLVFCYRSTILRDKTMIDSIPDHGLRNLVTEWHDRSVGNIYAFDGIKEARKSYRRIQRNVLLFPVSRRLERYQRIDILPEFILQERVDGVPPGQKLLDSAKKAHAKNQAHHPQNIYRASGRR